MSKQINVITLAEWTGRGRTLASLPIVEGSDDLPRPARRRISGLRKTKTKEYDHARHALQSPISYEKNRVIYLVSGREKRSPWYYRIEHGRAALNIIRSKYGQNNAILFRD